MVKISDSSQKEYLQKWKEFIKNNPDPDFQEQDDDNIDSNQEDEQVHSINNTRMILEIFP